MIRRRIREEGFLRRIIPPQTVTNDDLNRVLQHVRDPFNTTQPRGRINRPR
jgi:hypothetical protein